MGNAAELDLNPIIYQELSYRSFERFVKKHYNLNYNWSFIADQKSSNDTSHTFSIEKETLTSYEIGELHEFKHKNNQTQCWLSQTILTDLCNSGLIPEANYLIEVSW